MTVVYIGVSSASKMAAIRHSIQKELFSPNEERLLAIVSVTKAGGRKKRYSFITLSGTLFTLVNCYGVH